MDLRDIEVQKVAWVSLWAHRMRDGRFVMLNNVHARVEVYDHNGKLVEAGPDVKFSSDSNPDVNAVSADSNRVIVTSFFKTEISVVNIQKKVVEHSFKFKKESVLPKYMLFGPNKTVLFVRDGRLFFIRHGESEIGGEFKIPKGYKAMRPESDEESRIFLPLYPEDEEDGVAMMWMITVDGNTNQTDVVRMFEFTAKAMPRIQQVTPSVVCSVILDTFFVYDIFKKQLIYERAGPASFSSFYAISPDGRARLVYNRNTGIVCIIPLEMTKEVIKLAEKATYDENADKVWGEVDDEDEEVDVISLQVASYPMKDGGTVDALMMIDDETTQLIEGIEEMVGNRLYLTVKTESNYDIIFPKALVPISTVKSPTGRWARIMSNRRLETHLTWPEVGVKLPAAGDMGTIIDTFAGDPALMDAIAWFSCNRSIESDKEAVPPKEALGIYLQRIAHAIAVAVGIVQ